MIVLHDLTGIYEEQTFYKNHPHLLIKQRELSGVRGYMEERTFVSLLKECKRLPSDCRIHFLDSGNFHHFSFLYTCLIQEDFNLVVFDNHTDMQGSAFGSILSCGSWILEALERNAFLKKVFLVGVKPAYIETCFYQNDERVHFLDSLKEMKDEDLILPIYLSIDKDVLSKEEFLCDWDQGRLTLDEVLADLNFLSGRAKLLGVDICGEPENKPGVDIASSDRINQDLLKAFFAFFPPV